MQQSTLTLALSHLRQSIISTYQTESIFCHLCQASCTCIVGVPLSSILHASILRDVRGPRITLAPDSRRHTAKLFLFRRSDSANRPRANHSWMLVRPLHGSHSRPSTIHMTLRRGRDSIMQSSRRNPIISTIVCFKDCQ